MAEPYDSDVIARILIVDDEPAGVAHLVNALSCCGYQVETTTSGAEALRILERRPCKLLISDMQMPEMRGDELQKLALKKFPGLGVLLLATPGDTMRAVNCLKEGAHDFITKPYELMEAVVRVRHVLDRLQLEHEVREMRERTVHPAPTRGEIMLDHAQESLTAFINALESKDEYTHNHSARVSELSALIAHEVKPRDKEFQTEIRFAAFLHDIGKIGIRETVINKPGALTPKEYAEVQKHTTIGETILRPLVANPEVLAIVRNHHEWWNGKGYPDGLAGTAIPFGARIVAVADSYDAMTSARPYRVPMSHERALEILREGAGEQWDRNVVQSFIAVVNDGRLPVWPRTGLSRREKVLPTASDKVLPSDHFLRNAG